MRLKFIQIFPTFVFFGSLHLSNKKDVKTNVVRAETENKLIHIPRSVLIYCLLNHLYERICYILNIFGRWQTFIAVLSQLYL